MFPVTLPRLALASGMTALVVLASAAGTAVMTFLILVPFARAASFRCGRLELDPGCAAAQRSDRPEGDESHTNQDTSQAACEPLTFVD
jgi:hypothetical protein